MIKLRFLYTYFEIYEMIFMRMVLSFSAADQAAEIRHGFSLDLRLVKLVPMN